MCVRKSEGWLEPHKRIISDMGIALIGLHVCVNSDNAAIIQQKDPIANLGDDGFFMSRGERSIGP